MSYETMHVTGRTKTSGKQNLGMRDCQKFDPMDKTNLELTDGILTRAIKDARQSQDRSLQQEALAWLWVCCPDIADDLSLPALETGAIQPDVSEYLQRYSAFSLS
jgi:hypothetical protein